MEKIKAIISRSDRRIFECLDLKTNEIYKATAPARLLAKKFNENLVVGDFVELTLENDEYFIQNKKPRKNELNRSIPREKTLKTIAANIDYLLIICSVSSPPYRSNLIDRFLARSFYHDIEPIVVFNKCDQLTDEFDLNHERTKFDYLKIKNFAISAKSDLNDQINAEIPQLRELLEKKTAVFWGQSGVGKSKLISLLSEGRVKLKSKEVGKVGKGVHTTTWAELINLGQCYLIDTPGIRSFSLIDIEYDSLITLFPELHDASQNCQFHDCNHEEKTKGCYFHSDQFKESDEYQMISSRFENFLNIRNDLMEGQKKY